MNDLNNALRQQYRPELAVIVYANTGDGHDYYLESHAINDAGQLLEGKSLKAETIAGMVEIFRGKQQQETRIGGNIPQCLLSYTPATGGEYRMIWYRPARQQMMYYTPETKLKSGLAMVPPTLYVATAAHLHVWTLATGKRPGPKSKVHAAPYYNVNGQGRVCLGSAKVKVPAVKTFENLIAYWEELFWGSKFSAVHNNGAVTGGLQKLWAAQLRRKDRPFPMAQLAQSKLILQTILNGKGSN